MHIRHFAKEDINGVQLLISSQRSLVLYPPYTYWLISHFFASTSFVLEHEGRIIGYIGGLPINNKKILFIWHYIAHTTFRGRISGYGLINTVIDLGLEQGYQFLQCTIRQDNLKSYNSMKRALQRRGLKLEPKGTESLYDVTSNETITFNMYQCPLQCDVTPNQKSKPGEA